MLKYIQHAKILLDVIANHSRSAAQREIAFALQRKILKETIDKSIIDSFIVNQHKTVPKEYRNIKSFCKFRILSGELKDIVIDYRPKTSSYIPRPCVTIKRGSGIVTKQYKHIVPSERYLNLTYGITQEDYVAMYNKQEGKCAICGITEEQFGRSFFVDHCHDTLAVRGLLCLSCNSGIGIFKDSTERLSSAITYLNQSIN